jgi:hypothetical protein
VRGAGRQEPGDPITDRDLNANLNRRCARSATVELDRQGPRRMGHSVVSQSVVAETIG